MGWGMARKSIGRVRLAAMILSVVGAVLAAATPSHAQSATGAIAADETASAALARHVRTLATSPKDFTALIGAGRAALELGDTQSAGGFFGRADEVFPRSPQPQAGMGAAAVADGDASGALIYFARAVELGATPTMIGADRGLAYDLQGRHSEAQADYRAALSGPNSQEARRRLALSLAITGDKDAALAALAPLAAKGDAAAARCRALVLAVAGDPDGARRLLDLRMPGSGAQMDRFFRQLPRLRSDQKAAAVHLGVFPDDVGTSSYAVAVSPSAPPVTAAPPPYAGDRIAAVDKWLRAPAAPKGVQMARLASVPRTTMPRSGPNREKVWLQLASGADATAMPDQFRRLKARNRELLDGISGFVAQEPSKARLLIGPFKNKTDADTFAEDLESVRVDAFSWTSPPDAAIRKLSE